MVMFVEKVLRTKEQAVITPPAMQTGRQPYLLVSAPATGPSGQKSSISKLTTFTYLTFDVKGTKSDSIYRKIMLYSINCTNNIIL